MASAKSKLVCAVLEFAKTAFLVRVVIASRCFRFWQARCVLRSLRRRHEEAANEAESGSSGARQGAIPAKDQTGQATVHSSETDEAFRSGPLEFEIHKGEKS
jgi:hypothetical protein